MLTRLLFVLLATIAAVMAGGASCRPAHAQGLTAVDLELLLAVDTSASVDRREYDLQVEGLVRAFQDPGVVAAIKSTGSNGIAVALLHWSSANQQHLVVPWTRLRSGIDAFKFSASIAKASARQFVGSTGIGGAVLAGERSIRRNRFEGRRKSIDVSGDGPNNSGVLPSFVRDQVVAAGVTINGLTILNESPFLDRYYRREVIGGPNSFVMTVKDYEDVVEGMRRKLIREISTAIADAGPPLPIRLE
ncbi:MAG: DUF1194 domain-containing protein [Aestuariivirgaceae bacterium]